MQINGYAYGMVSHKRLTFGNRLDGEMNEWLGRGFDAEATAEIMSWSASDRRAFRTEIIQEDRAEQYNDTPRGRRVNNAKKAREHSANTAASGRDHSSEKAKSGRENSRERAEAARKKTGGKTTSDKGGTTSTGTGDPLYITPEGRSFEFHGKAGHWYDALSNRNLQLNVLMGNNWFWSMLGVKRSGTWMTAAAIQHASGARIGFFEGSAQPKIDLNDGKGPQLMGRWTYRLGNGDVAQWHPLQQRLTIDTNDLDISIRKELGRNTPFDGQLRIDVRTDQEGLDDTHGIIGQFYRKDHVPLTQDGDRGPNAQGGGAMQKMILGGKAVLSKPGDQDVPKFYEVSKGFATDDPFSQYRDPKRLKARFDAIVKGLDLDDPEAKKMDVLV